MSRQATKKHLHAVQQTVQGKWRQVKTPALLAPVLAAVFLATVYYGLIASDRYVATASFVIRGTEAQKADLVGMLTGVPGQAGSHESHILRDYLTSRDFLGKLRGEVPLEEIFRRPGADVLSRLKSDPSLEDLQGYWKRRAEIVVDQQTDIITLNISAFTPEDSMVLVAATLKAGEDRLNDMSLRSRRDTLKIAQDELAESIRNLNGVRSRMAEFRTRHKMLDPEQTAAAQQGITGRLEAELVARTAEHASLLTYMRPAAPQAVTLQKRIDSLRGILDTENAKNIETLLSQDNPETSQPLIDEYNQLLIDREVAEKTYVAAIQFLETARIDSLGQRSYVTVFSEPRMPEEATEPNRLKNIGTVAVLALLFWGIGQLIMATVREHRQWNL